MGTGQFELGQQEFFLARTRLRHVDGGPCAPLTQTAVEGDLHIAGALELFEDHLVHAAARIDQGGTDDGQAAALFDVARRGEKPPRVLEGRRVHATCEDPSGVWRDHVVGARQTRDAVEKDDHIALVLGQSFGFLDDHLRHLHVPRRRLVEGGTDDLAVDGARHLGHLLGALIDEQDDDDALGMVARDRIGQLLQQHGLTGEGRRYDQAALSLTDGRQQVEDPRRRILWIVLQLQPLTRVQSGEVFEDRLALGDLRILEVDRLHP